MRKTNTRRQSHLSSFSSTNTATAAATSTSTTNSNAATTKNNMSASNKLLLKVTCVVLLMYFIMSWWILFHKDSYSGGYEHEHDHYQQHDNGGAGAGAGAEILDFDTSSGVTGHELEENVLDKHNGIQSSLNDSIGSGSGSGSSIDYHQNKVGQENKVHEEEVEDQQDHVDQRQFQHSYSQSQSHPHQLMAFMEPIHQEDWSIKPLPVRNTTWSILQQRTFDRIACSTLHQQWPTDEKIAPTNQDPFLPWIHDVFPTADGKYIQFIAQNKRRCQSGIHKQDIKDFMQPNVALFQHVPVTRIYNDNDTDTDRNVRYRISSHEEADPDGIETRFICRFKPTMEETLSVFNLNYDYHTLRKAYKASFTKEGFDNHMIWTSQLLFKCPVPESLQEQIRLGTSVVDDYATLFVDVIPIRTPPRYGSPTRYLPPRLFSDKNDWDPAVEWGEQHILPRLNDSGRWENIPICKPSLMTYPYHNDNGNGNGNGIVTQSDVQIAEMARNNTKKRLIACTWTSSLFETRGGKTKVKDGDQRLIQWLKFNQLVGVDHVYVYDNSGAFSGTDSLKSVTDLFPGFATRIDWPAKVCNNRPNNMDNKGERSSQYAATMSCHLRFGVHSDWLMAADTDEYMVPMGDHDSLKDLLTIAEREDIKVLNWKSKRSKPRLQYFNVTPSSHECKVQKCFDPSLPQGQTFLEVYNCNIEKPPRMNVMPAEKAIYRPDFVVLFFVHYATATVLSQMGKPEAQNLGINWNRRYRVANLRYVDEEGEGTMLHTKAIVEKEIRYWNRSLQVQSKNSKLGVEWPIGTDENHNSTLKTTIHGTRYSPNCYPVPKIDEDWVPLLVNALNDEITYEA